MVDRKPLVVVDGQLSELPSGDSLDAPSDLLPTPSHIDDTSSTDYFYFGWDNLEDGWLIERQLRVDGTVARIDAGYATMQDAWNDRASADWP